MKEQPPFDLQELQGKMKSMKEFVEEQKTTKDIVLIPQDMCAVTVQATTHRSAHARCNSVIAT